MHVAASATADSAEAQAAAANGAAEWPGFGILGRGVSGRLSEADVQLAESARVSGDVVLFCDSNLAVRLACVHAKRGPVPHGGPHEVAIPWAVLTAAARCPAESDAVLAPWVLWVLSSSTRVLHMLHKCVPILMRGWNDAARTNESIVSAVVHFSCRAFHSALKQRCTIDVCAVLVQS